MIVAGPASSSSVSSTSSSSSSPSSSSSSRSSSSSSPATSSASESAISLSLTARLVVHFVVAGRAAAFDRPLPLSAGRPDGRPGRSGRAGNVLPPRSCRGPSSGSGCPFVLPALPLVFLFIFEDACSSSSPPSSSSSAPCSSSSSFGLSRSVPDVRRVCLAPWRVFVSAVSPAVVVALVFPRRVRRWGTSFGGTGSGGGGIDVWRVTRRVFPACAAAAAGLSSSSLCGRFRFMGAILSVCALRVSPMATEARI